MTDPLTVRIGMTVAEPGSNPDFEELRQTATAAMDEERRTRRAATTDSNRLRLANALTEAMRNHPIRSRKFRLFMVAALPEHILAIVPKEYRSILYHIEKLADLPVPVDWRQFFARTIPCLSEREVHEVHALHESLGFCGSLLDMMCRKALRGWFDQTEVFVWSSLAHPFRNGFPPHLVNESEGTASRDWRAVISPEEELAGMRRMEGLMACILFRPAGNVTVDRSVLTWNDGVVGKLARAIYQERSFADLPILADALEEAGCDEPSILAHCRQPGQPHGRGCWVLDLLAGRD
jgi:hypothetical protein